MPPFPYLLATYLHRLDPVIVSFGRLKLHWYGLAYVLAFLTGYWLYRWLSQRRYNDLKPDEVADFITWAAIFGVMVGGRLGHVLFYSWSETVADPLSAFRVWEGGMSSHGGILGLVFFTLYWSIRHKRSWTSIGDSLVVVAPIGLFLVRCANFINGELYGKVIAVAGSIPWAVQFPTELDPENRPPLQAIQQDPGVQEQLRRILPERHPSQIYEALLEGVVLFLILWVLRTRFKLPRGVLTGAFFICYAILRIIGEVYRVPDPSWSVGHISAGQFLSLFMPLLGIAFIVWGFRTRQYEAAFAPATEPATK